MRIGAYTVSLLLIEGFDDPLPIKELQSKHKMTRIQIIHPHHSALDLKSNRKG